VAKTTHAQMKSRHDDHLFDKRAPTYDRSILQRLLFAPVQRAVLDAFSAASAPPHDVLDVGCGTGRLLEAAALRWGEARLTGVDVSEPMVAQARSKHEGNARFKFLRADAAALPLEPESADAAFSTMSFHHWGNQALGIREVARVLRAGGIFVLADVYIPLLFLLHPLVNRSDHATFLAPHEILQLFERANLTVVTHRHSLRLRGQLFVAQKKESGPDSSS